MIKISKWWKSMYWRHDVRTFWKCFSRSSTNMFTANRTKLMNCMSHVHLLWNNLHLQIVIRIPECIWERSTQLKMAVHVRDGMNLYHLFITTVTQHYSLMIHSCLSKTTVVTPVEKALLGATQILQHGPFVLFQSVLVTSFNRRDGNGRAFVVVA